MINRKNWNRRLWGIVYTCRSEAPLLLGTAWDKTPRDVPRTEPTRTLLFTRREDARRWCRAKNADNRALNGTFRVVSVREIVTIEAIQEE